MAHWWDDQPDERFWVEITDRDDLGENVVAPQVNEDGRTYWSYEMVKWIHEGDLVLHLRTPESAFTHWSRAVGHAYEDTLNRK